MILYHVLPEGDPVGGSREAEKVSIALREAGVAVEVKNLSRERDLRPPDGWFRRNVNPMGMVPALDDDGFILLESGAILRYLADKYPEARLLPSDPREKARAQQWVFWEGTALGPSLLNLCFAHPIKDADAAVFEAVIPFRESSYPRLVQQNAYEQFGRRVGVLDQALNGRDFVANNQFSIADLALGPHIAISSLVDFNLKPYTNVVRWLTALARRSSWRQEPGFIADYEECRQKRLI